MRFSTFNNERDKWPGRGEASWEQIAQALSEVRATACTLATCTRSGSTALDGSDIPPCPHKYGLAWSPAAWPPGAKRKVYNVDEVCVLVVDLDHIKPAELPALLSRFRGLKIILHASHSDRPEDRCLRVVVALSRPVAGKDWPRFWTAAMRMLAVPADPKCKDGSRLYFRPSRPHDACEPTVDGSGYTFDMQDGAALDVDAILAAAPPEAEIAFEEYDVPDFTGAPPMEKIVAAVRALAAAWPAPGRNRHDAHLALAGALARAGWPAELIADFACAVAHTQIPGSGDYRKRLGAARSSVEKAQTGALIKGWPSLQQVLEASGTDGRAAVEAATEALGMRRGPKLDDTEVADFAQSLAPSSPPTQDVVTDMVQSFGAPTAHPPAAPMLTLVPQVEAPAPAGPAVPSAVTIDAQIKATQRTLASRKDPDSIRDAEYLKRIERGELLTDDGTEDPLQALCFGALALARAGPAGTTAEQLQRRLVTSAGTLASKLPQVVHVAMTKAVTMAPLTAARSRRDDAGNAPLDEFVLKKTGDDAGMPAHAAQHNFRVALRRLGVNFRYNAFTCNEVIVRDDREDVVEDHHINALAFECEQKFGFYPPESKWKSFCDTLAREDTYHPPRDYIESLPKDAPLTGLVDEWLIRFAGAPDSLYVRAISRLVLVAAVRRIRQPGCKFDEMLILETPEQGKNKSSALRALVPNDEWFTDDFRLDASDTRKMMESTSGRWLVEAGELKGMSTGLAADMKQYLSRREDSARMAYGRKLRRVKRQFIIIGTTNEDEYLRDQTGNRRYWPVRVVEFDVEALVAHRDQLWAEAARLDLENPSEKYIRLDPSLYAAAAKEQNKRAVLDPNEVVLSEAIGGIRGRLPVRDAWKIAGYHDEKQPSKLEAMQVSSAMSKLGFGREQFEDENGGISYFYVRGVGEERNLDLTIAGTAGQYRVRPGVPRSLAPASEVPPRQPDRASPPN